MSRGSDGFYWSSAPEPHGARRREILEKYPSVRELEGPCPRTKYICTALVLIQIGIAASLRDAPFWLIALVAYGIGGVINQSLLLAIHEISHNLAFKRPIFNRWFGIFVNLPIGVPVSAAFREYHLLHHAHQGDPSRDTDIPTRWEASWVRGRGAKLIWTTFQGFAYALRPMFVLPMKPSRWVLVNFAVQITFDVAIYLLLGGKSLLYFPLGTLLVMGLHPMAGHFISEHYVFRPGQETYSYYGPLNRIAFNVGYHNEHHDFPSIAGSRLPRLKALASEYYDSLAHHTSWTRVLYDYVMRDDVGATSRVKRSAREGRARPDSPRET